MIAMEPKLTVRASAKGRASGMDLGEIEQFIGLAKSAGWRTGQAGPVKVKVGFRGQVKSIEADIRLDSQHYRLKGEGGGDAR